MCVCVCVPAHVCMSVCVYMCAHEQTSPFEYKRQEMLLRFCYKEYI